MKANKEVKLILSVIVFYFLAEIFLSIFFSMGNLLEYQLSMRCIFGLYFIFRSNLRSLGVSLFILEIVHSLFTINPIGIGILSSLITALFYNVLKNFINIERKMYLYFYSLVGILFWQLMDYLFLYLKYHRDFSFNYYYLKSLPMYFMFSLLSIVIYKILDLINPKGQDAQYVETRNV